MRRIPRCRIALAAVVALSACGRGTRAPDQPTYSAEVEARVSAVTGDLASRMNRDGVPGVSIAVVHRGAIDWARGFGVREAQGRDPVDVNTLFQAASLSRGVTAAGALVMAQAGQLALDRNVNEQLVSWKLPENGFTANAKVVPLQLLSHTGGVTVSGFAGYRPDAAVPTLTQVLDGQPPANSEAVRVFRTPGTRFDYSGGGYTILQLMMEERAGVPFAELMESRVLRPLGMLQSTFAQPLPQARQAFAASGHRSGPRTLDGSSRPRWHVYPEKAAAGLWTTPSDLAAFVIEVAQAYAGTSNGVLTPASARAMLTPVAENYGLGLGVFTRGDGRTLLFSHDGLNAGFRAFLFGLTGVEQGVVVMTNSDDSETTLARDLVDSVARVYGWPR